MNACSDSHELNTFDDSIYLAPLNTPQNDGFVAIDSDASITPQHDVSDLITLNNSQNDGCVVTSQHGSVMVKPVAPIIPQRFDILNIPENDGLVATNTGASITPHLVYPGASNIQQQNGVGVVNSSNY